MAGLLPISLNPCEDLNAYVDMKTNALEQAGVNLKSKVNALKNKLKAFAEVPSTQGAIDDAIALATVGDIGAGTTAMTQIKNFTGTCLDSVYNGIRSYALDIDGEVTDAIDNITSFVSLPEVNLLKPLRAARTALGAGQLENLIAELDQKLGCLTEQGSELGECLSSVDNFSDRIDDVLNYLGLGDDGTFDLDTFKDHFSIDINSDSFSNLKNLDVKIDELTAEAKENIKSILPANVLPEIYK